MNTPPDATDKTDIPVLQQPAADNVSDDMLDELDVPILTTPAEGEEPPKDQ